MIYLLYFLYAWLNGDTEAFLYSRKGAEALPDNEHKWFVKERILVAVVFVAGIVYGLGFGWWALWLAGGELAASVLALSFFRDGFYNLMRDRISGTRNGWSYSSPTDESKVHFDYSERRRHFWCSLALLAITYTLYILLP